MMQRRLTSTVVQCGSGLTHLGDQDDAPLSCLRATMTPRLPGGDDHWPSRAGAVATTEFPSMLQQPIIIQQIPYIIGSKVHPKAGRPRPCNWHLGKSGEGQLAGATCRASRPTGTSFHLNEMELSSRLTFLHSKAVGRRSKLDGMEVLPLASL